MANRTYGDWDGRGQDTSDHSTGNIRGSQCDIQDVVGMTSVQEQIDCGGWTRVEMPMSDDGSNVPLVRSKLMGGGADQSGRAFNVAAKAPPRFPGPPGETT